MNENSTSLALQAVAETSYQIAILAEKKKFHNKFHQTLTGKNRKNNKSSERS